MLSQGHVQPTKLIPAICELSSEKLLNQNRERPKNSTPLQVCKPSTGS